MSVVREWSLADCKPREYDEHFDNVDPPVTWYPTKGMTVDNDRQDFGEKLTELGDQFVDMPGFSQRAPGWGYARFITSCSSSNIVNVQGLGFVQAGSQWFEETAKLVKQKTGQVKPDPPSEDTIRGVEDESPLQEEVEDRLGVRILNVPMIPHGVWVKDGKMYKLSGAMEMFGVSLDGIIIKSDNFDDRRVIVEFKNPRHLDINKFVTYLQQVQYQMWCVNADACYLIQGIAPRRNMIGRWQIMIERIPRDPNWAYNVLGHAVSYTEYIRQYRISHGITYNKFLKLIS